MDKELVRQGFETWVLKNWPNQSLDRFSPLHAVTEGEYQGFMVQHCWEAWQASREAVVVELPSAIESPPYACFQSGWNDMRGEAVDAIEAQGLKVKP